VFLNFFLEVEVSCWVF